MEFPVIQQSPSLPFTTGSVAPGISPNCIHVSLVLQGQRDHQTALRLSQVSICWNGPGVPHHRCSSLGGKLFGTVQKHGAWVTRYIQPEPCVLSMGKNLIECWGRVLLSVENWPHGQWTHTVTIQSGQGCERNWNSVPCEQTRGSPNKPEHE